MKIWHAIIIALGIMGAGIGYGWTQQTAPAQINGCVYFSTPPSLTNGQSSAFTCDSTGKLRVTTS